MSERSGSRLLALDALRGVAALSVVLFHYTTRFDQLFAPPTRSAFAFPHGHYGVNLFFIISGFVIFMTLERTRRPADFVVSRFSRLFPTYWMAILLTFSITHALGLPGKLVGAGTALANAAMLHGLFGVAHVDGVYWTLEVELLFYFGMFALYLAGQLKTIHLAMALVLSIRWVYFAASQAFGIDLPWTIYRLLILEHLPWFALGIAIHSLTRAQPVEGHRQPLGLAGFALLTLAITDSPLKAGLAAALSAAVWLAVSGRARILQWSPLVWLGSISYSLYLIHENIGWCLLLRLDGRVTPEVAVGLTLAVALGLSHALTRIVEQPAMRWVRTRYRKWQVSTVGSGSAKGSP